MEKTAWVKQQESLFRQRTEVQFSVYRVQSIYIYIYIYTHTYIYIHIYIYTHKRTEVQFSVYRVQSEGGGGRERQVVAGELIKSPTRKDLNEQCWDFTIKATGSL